MQHFEGEVLIKASRAEVWAFLMDPYKVGQCMPGVESVEVIDGERKFRAVAAIGFGSVKARFKGEAEFTAIEEPNWATLKAHGNAPGSAMDVVSLMVLSDGPDGTVEMQWSADITVLGTLASLAARLMGGITKKLSNQFFECFKTKIENIET
jgi:carbon monoxide dehydrogenase subunit G